QSAALIPSNVFEHGTEGNGLLAEYFDNPEMNGQPKVSRVELRPFIQAGVPDAATTAAFPKGAYAVRWTATLHPPVTGDYTITPAAGFARGAVKIFLDDKELEADTPQAAPGARGGGRGGPVNLKVHLDA